ncbi:hypothetical protein [Dyadobacter sp. CY312]|uniref:hypothetical protein n=1 Tax=Dyadobacter sp. CY312 TaxID=2907303 RepID=UPI001F3F94AD|nr:hypothetical protein [Dyadobacter sp. CY312]MCE7043260.1 hypothetical protein [Dyadobacter sp. CY312]
MTEEPLQKEHLHPQQEEKLRDLTSQSWNLELVISGAALFAVLQLPDLLDVAFDYLRFNILSHTTGIIGVFPSLVFSMMKAICYILFAAFLTNFVMRAFWVGLVGLLSVYPTGIHYDRIPFTSKYAQEQMSGKFGSLQNYIIRLDRRCNIVFAVAFLFTFFFILIAMGYLVAIIVYTYIRPLIPDDYMPFVKLLCYALAGIYLLASIILSLPAVRATPTGARLNYKFSTILQFLYWGTARPSGFIVNTFYSHIPSKKLVRNMAFMLVGFVLIMTVNLLIDMSRQNQRFLVFNGRHLFSARVDSVFVDANSYDNQRPEGQYVRTATIQSDIVREPFIRLYIAYPKALDTLLTEISKEPVWNETKPIAERRREYADWSSQQINSLIQVRVNDSLYQNPGLLFTLHDKPTQHGWQTVLMPNNLITGRNTLKISIQPKNPAKPTTIATIPFWYAAEL